MHAKRPHPRVDTTIRAAVLRSAVTNGRKLFVEGDGNSAWSRRYRDLIAAFVSDLGGHDALSEAKLALIRRSAALALELEQMEGKLSQGDEINLDSYGRAASHLRRLLETLGVERKPKDVTPSLEEYAQQRRFEAAG